MFNYALRHPLLSVFALSFSVAVSAQTPATEKLGIYGSNTVGAELMPELVSAYADTLSAVVNTSIGAKSEERRLTAKNMQGHALFEVDLKAHGSGTAFPALANGSAKIGMASRPIKAKEEKQLQQSGITKMRDIGKEHVVALDGLVVIVSPDNPISSLSLSQISKLFAGEINNWSQLGGDNKPVTVYARDNNSGTYDTFKGLVLKPNGKKLSSKAKRFESNEELSDAVSIDAGGIGFTGFAYVRNAKTLSLASDCGLVYEPTIFSVKTEEYPLSRRLYLYNTGTPLAEHAKRLMDYSLSDEAQSVIADVGFIDQSVDSLAFEEQGQRWANTISPANLENVSKELPIAQNLFEQLKQTQRLSTTFRFNTGSASLDVKAAQDIRRIANMLTAPDSVYKDKSIYLIGFTDSAGSFAQNLKLSKNRALQVYNTLRPLLNRSVLKRVSVYGYSELSPVSCNTSPIGRGKNRRVEIWVK